MLKYLFLSICLLAFSHPAGAMKATAEVYQFRSADGPYVEVFFYIIGSTVASSQDSRKSVQIKYFIERDSAIYAGDNYNLVVDALGVSDFMDLRRHMLQPGEYQFRAEIRDNQDTSSIVHVEQAVIIQDNDQPSFSDLQLLSKAAQSSEKNRWTKNGIEIIPLPYHYYGSQSTALRVYTELYGADEVIEDMFYLKFSVSLESQPGKPLLETHKRMTPAPVSPILESVDIGRLTSGNYKLQVGAYSRNHQLISEKSTYFTRSNPSADSLVAINSGRYFEYSFTKQMDSDSLRYVLKSLAPKISPTQMDALNYLIKKGDMAEQRKFIHEYWLQIDNRDPQAAFVEYMERVHYADRVFSSGFGHGFETDRGRIYLRYGAPNDVVSVEDEPSAPPYEIWIYERFPVTGQGVVKFLFYAPELANSYELLHSTCDQEIRNPAWEQMLYKDALSETSSGDLIDARPVQDNFYRRAREFFTDF